MSNFEIQMAIITPIKMTLEEFTDLFFEWVELNDFHAGGGIVECDDEGNYINTD